MSPSSCIRIESGVGIGFQQTFERCHLHIFKLFNPFGEQIKLVDIRRKFFIAQALRQIHVIKFGQPERNLAALKLSQPVKHTVCSVALHKLKLRIEYCDDVLKGNKTFEVRKNDRDFKVGDLIMFTPVDLTSECEHQISDELFVITYILSNFLNAIDKDYCVLSLKHIEIDSLPF